MAAQPTTLTILAKAVPPPTPPLKLPFLAARALVPYPDCLQIRTFSTSGFEIGPKVRLLELGQASVWLNSRRWASADSEKLVANRKRFCRNRSYGTASRLVERDIPDLSSQLPSWFGSRASQE